MSTLLERLQKALKAAGNDGRLSWDPMNQRVEYSNGDERFAQFVGNAEEVREFAKDLGAFLRRPATEALEMYQEPNMVVL